VKKEKFLVKMEKMEKMEKIIVIFKKVLFTIQYPPLLLVLTRLITVWSN
jgi:hypothetical protein